MSSKTNPNVSKLLRVLVAGGVALAGVGARAADNAASTEPAKNTAAKDKDQKKSDAGKSEKDKKKAEADKKSAKSDQPGGVKGW